MGYPRTSVPDAILTIESAWQWLPNSILTIESYWEIGWKQLILPRILCDLSPIPTKSFQIVKLAWVTWGHWCPMPTLQFNQLGISYPILSLLLNCIGKLAENSWYCQGFYLIWAQYLLTQSFSIVKLAWWNWGPVPDDNLTIKSVWHWVPDSTLAIKQA